MQDDINKQLTVIPTFVSYLQMQVFLDHYSLLAVYLKSCTLYMHVPVNI